jgi:hypothetical protein
MIMSESFEDEIIYGDLHCGSLEFSIGKLQI